MLNLILIEAKFQRIKRNHFPHQRILLLGQLKIANIFHHLFDLLSHILNEVVFYPKTDFIVEW